jgi:hypothetical protein
MTDIELFLNSKVKQSSAKADLGDAYYLPPPVYSEFASGGNLNYARITTKYEIYCTFGDFINAVEKVFGTLLFRTDKDTPSEITKEEFLAMYEFGVFSKVRDWQFAVYAQKNQYISLEDLFNWVLETE